MDCLMRYSWPGNVRELQNVIERAASLAENGIITICHLPAELYAPVLPLLPFQETPLVQPLGNREQRKKIFNDAEKNQILHLLNIYGGNVSQVARELEVSRKTLYNKIHRYTIDN